MRNTIRILHCTVQLNRGGYETLLMNLLRELAPRGIYFDFITSLPGSYDLEAEQLGASIFNIPFITKVGPFAYAHSLRQVLQCQTPRIFHSHMDKFSGLALREAARLAVPVRIAHAHSTHNEGNLAYQVVKNYYGKKILPNATDLFACSAAAAKWMYGTAATSARLLYNGIALDSFLGLGKYRTPTRESLRVGNAFVLGHIGRFTKPKNHRFLLQIFKEICVRRADAQLLLVGDGPLRAEIQGLAKREGLLDRIHFLGVREDILALLSAMDAFVFPSLYEGLGMSLVEAQAANLPCVCSTAVPLEAVVSPRVCRLSLDDSASTWASAILAPSVFSPQGAQMEDYDIHRVAEELALFYQEKWGL